MKLIVVGTSKFSRMLKEYINDLGIEVIAYAVDREFIKSNEIDGIPVIAIDALNETYSPKDVQLVLGIGYTQLGNLKREIFERCKKMNYHFFNYVHPTAVIDKTVEIGEGNLIFENVVIQKHAKMGSGNLLFSNAVIMHDNQIGSFVTFGAGSVSNGFVEVQDCCFIGANATIRDGVTIGKNTLVGAGAYVNRSTKENTAVLPARSFYKNDSGILLSEKL